MGVRMAQSGDRKSGAEVEELIAFLRVEIRPLAALECEFGSCVGGHERRNHGSCSLTGGAAK